VNETDKPKIGALAPWFGGKRTMASDIVTKLGKHTQFFEPFCGSMAVLLQKDPSQKETVNDLHGDLVNLAEVIQYEVTAEILYERLQRTLFTEAVLESARVVLSQQPANDMRSKVQRAYYYFIASWMGRNGTAGTARLDYQIAVRWTKNGGSPTVRFKNAVDSIPAWHLRLGNVVILSRDAFQVMDRFEDVAGTAIFADPPHCDETRSKGAIKNGRGGKYLHEFDHDRDHERLAEILRGYRKARVVVSYYDCERIRKLYDGWTFIDHSRQKFLHNQNGRGSRPLEAPEVLIVNGESFAKTTNQLFT
jgi:DNA adenine methylase